MGQIPAGRKAPGAEERRSWEQAARLTRQQETSSLTETEGGFSGADARKGHTGPERLCKVCPMLGSEAWEPLTQMLPRRKKERGERETGHSPGASEKEGAPEEEDRTLAPPDRPRD